MRYIDRTVATAAGVVLAVLVGFQSYAVWNRRAILGEELAEAKALAEQADANELPDMPRTPDAHSGEVFKAWENLPFARSLDAWDFYPDQPPRRR